MKKNNVLSAMLVLSVLCIADSYAAGKINSLSDGLKFLSGMHVRAFSHDNIFNQKLDINPWYDVCAEMEQFITDNSRGNLVGSIKGMQDSTIINPLKKLVKFNADAVSALQVLWNAYFSKKKALTNAEFKQAEQLLFKLKPIKSFLETEKKNSSLMKLTKGKSDDPRTAASTLLTAWMEYLLATIDKALKDFYVIQAQYIH